MTFSRAICCCSISAAASFSRSWVAGELAPDVAERVLDHFEPLPRALDVLLGGWRGAGNGPGHRHQHQERRDDGGTRRSGEVSSGLGHVIGAPARGKVGGPARTACQVPGPLATILDGERAPCARASRRTRSLQIFDQLQRVAVGIVERGESSEPGNLRLVPVEDHPSLLQSPSRLIEVLDPEDDRPARRQRSLLGPVQGETDRAGLELRPFVARPDAPRADRGPPRRRLTARSMSRVQ